MYNVMFCASLYTDNVYEGLRRFQRADELLDHSSALLAFRFPVKFSGFNQFIGNLGGGVVLINSRLDVNGKLLLERNNATFGAGISLDDSCLVSNLRDPSTYPLHCC